MTDVTTTTPCSDFAALIPAFLDAELDAPELRDFEAHLNECSPCQERVEREERNHSALRSHLANPPQAPDLLRKRLLLELDKEDEKLQRQQRKSWMAWALPGGASAAAAAALALFLWKDLMTPQAAAPAPSSQVAQEAARRHFRDEPLMVRNGDRARVSKSAADYLQQDVRAPRFSSDEVRLIGWEPSQLSGQQSATFVYEVDRQTGRHRVNVHAVELGKVNLRGQKKVIIDDVPLLLDNALGFNTVTYAANRRIAYVFSSDMPMEDLIRLVGDSDLMHLLDTGR